MSTYYLIITLIAVLTMLGMIVCVSSSGTLSRKKKIYFRALFVCIAVAAFCEWFGSYLQGTGQATRILHIIVKASELSIAPVIGFLIAFVIEPEHIKPVIVFLAVHSCVELLSGFFGFVYQVDAYSTYTHAEFYWIYTMTYFISILYGTYSMVRSMKKYQYGGIPFLVMIVVLLGFGIAVQMYNSDMKVIFITVAVASVMLYVFTLEMIQQNDELTGLINRRGYENYIAHLEDRCMVLMFDVDRFKGINDQYGHPFGDLCLRNIGGALRQTYAKYGRCFRIGGDEFCVITTKEITRIDAINSSFFGMLQQQRQAETRLPYVSLGYAFFDPENSNIQDAFAEADKMMYKFKQEHKGK